MCGRVVAVEQPQAQIYKTTELTSALRLNYSYVGNILLNGGFFAVNLVASKPIRGHIEFLKHRNKGPVVDPYKVTFDLALLAPPFVISVTSLSLLDLCGIYFLR